MTTSGVGLVEQEISPWFLTGFFLARQDEHSSIHSCTQDIWHPIKYYLLITERAGTLITLLIISNNKFFLVL
jgi:hypothetical protein